MSEKKGLNRGFVSFVKAAGSAVKTAQAAGTTALKHGVATLRPKLPAAKDASFSHLLAAVETKGGKRLLPGRTVGMDCDDLAGFELLDYYQAVWAALHQATIQAAKDADVSAARVRLVAGQCTAHARAATQLAAELNATMPTLLKSIAAQTDTLQAIQGSLLGIEEALYELESSALESAHQAALATASAKAAAAHHQRVVEGDRALLRMRLQHQLARKQKLQSELSHAAEKSQAYHDLFAQQMEHFRKRGVADVPLGPGATSVTAVADIALFVDTLNDADAVALASFLGESTSDMDDQETVAQAEAPPAPADADGAPAIEILRTDVDVDVNA